MNSNHIILIGLCTLLLSGCGGGGYGSSNPPPAPLVAPGAPGVNIAVGTKQLIFSWAPVSGATHYKLLENPDGASGFAQVGADIPAGTLSVSLAIAVHFQDFANALYRVEACNTSGCTGSTEVDAMNGMLAAIGYFKASNTEEFDLFGTVALSADGNTMAVGAYQESSNATGINGDQNNNLAPLTGAVYLFRFDGMNWFQQAYIKASNWSADFGASVSLSADGNTLAVGATLERSNSTGINGDQNDTSAGRAGAVYVFRFDGVGWFQQSYIKASNTEADDNFGRKLALSADGNTLAVGAPREDSNATGINGDQNDNSAPLSGAVYVFRSDGINWLQQAYVKASNTGASDKFGFPVALSADGNTMAIGASREDSNTTGIDGNQNDSSAPFSGAVYLYRFDGMDWFQQAYVKASNSETDDEFGLEVALSADGDTLAVGAPHEGSNATGVNGNQNDNSAGAAGAVYVFRFSGIGWFQQAYVKALYSEGDLFGDAIALSADGNTLAAGAPFEDSSATAVGGDQADNSAQSAGAMHLFGFDGIDWSQLAYVKATNTEGSDNFGGTVALSADGNTMAITANEDSSATGINGDQNDDSAIQSGAIYLF